MTGKRQFLIKAEVGWFFLGKNMRGAALIFCDAPSSHQWSPEQHKTPLTPQSRLAYYLMTP